jgi:hypothetical protein
MVWRKSSAIAPFLKHLAGVFKELPHALLEVPAPRAGGGDPAPAARV